MTGPRTEEETSNAGLGNVESVSVVIPTHNRANLVMRAIESCLTQGSACGEVIVVDDHSTDDTARVVQSMTDSRVRYLAAASRGASAARNLGLREARGSLIKFLDDDDYLIAGALEGQLRDLEGIDPDKRASTIVFGDVYVLKSSAGSTPQLKVHKPKKRNELDVEYFQRQNILVTCPLHHRTMLGEIGGFDEKLPRATEYDLHLRLALAGASFVYRPTPVFVYDRVSAEGSLSRGELTPESLVGQFDVLCNHARLIHDAHPTGALRRLRGTLASQFALRRWQAATLGLVELERQCIEMVVEVSPWNPVIRRILMSRAVVRIRLRRRERANARRFRQVAQM